MNAAMPTAVLLVHLLHAATMAAPPGTVTADLNKAAASAIEDIAIAEDGTVYGRILVDPAAERPAGLRVKFVHDGRAVAIGAIDPEGIALSPDRTLYGNLELLLWDRIREAVAVFERSGSSLVAMNEL